jgi:hypothetical protein
MSWRVLPILPKSKGEKKNLWIFWGFMEVFWGFMEVLRFFWMLMGIYGTLMPIYGFVMVIVRWTLREKS